MALLSYSIVVRERGKSRVATSPPLTTPCQELLALTIGTRLAVHLLEIFGDKISDCTVWSDSKVALSWVFHDKSKEVFVINRAKEIKNLKSNHNIRLFYVCTEENPADLVTRGISMSLLGKSVLWFHGPTWIIHQNQFPEQEDVVYREFVNVNEILAEPSLRVPDDDVITFNCSEFSSLKHALRIVGRLIRFGRRIFPETFQEMNNLLVLIRIMQRQAFPTLYYALNNGLKENSSVPSELRNLIRQLGLYVDESGVIRCQGRIQNTDLSESAKHPVYVASRHPLWPLIVLHYHVLNLHWNINTLVIILQQQFWAGKIRQSVKKILKAYLLCKKVQNQPLSVPGERINHEVPFSCVGVDYTGNINVSESEAENEKAASWKGDFYERLIGVVKSCLHRALFKKRVSFTELTTIAAEAENIINNRPLTYVNEDNADDALTPAKLLYGRNITIAPPLNKLVDLSYHENVDLRENYAKLWKDTGTSSCQTSVLIVNKNCKIYKYTLGIIDQLHAGPDNVIRTVEIRTESGNFTRPLNQVIPLERNVTETSSTDNKQDEEGEAESPDVGDELESVANDETPDAPPLQMMCDRRPMRRAAVEADEHRKQLI
ncbi:uncharacterized protein [Palaemon carinicauda]|uniref:uncharacterized protein n=1 Tax=Palaemon carinicauda TaxID=392227 RepID=UPI0035B62C54